MENKDNIAYIDGANLHKGIESLGWKLDYRKFRIWLAEKYKITIANIFIGRIPGHDDIYSNLREAGFKLYFKETLPGKGKKIKGNCDTEMVAEAIRDYYENRLGKSVIISSDGDFSVLAKFMKDKGVLESIVSPRNSCSFLLRNLNAPLLYLDTQRNHLELIKPENKKALGGDQPPQRSFS